MKTRYDADADILYIRVADPLTYTSQEIGEGVVIDFEDSGKIVAIEIGDASKKLAISTPAKPAAKRDGGPAYPYPEPMFAVTVPDRHGGPMTSTAYHPHPGMSLRDAAALAVLPGVARVILSAHPQAMTQAADTDGFVGTYDEYIARRAYFIADAMIAERDR